MIEKFTSAQRDSLFAKVIKEIARTGNSELLVRVFCEDYPTITVPIPRQFAMKPDEYITLGELKIQLKQSL